MVASLKRSEGQKEKKNTSMKKPSPTPTFSTPAAQTKQFLPKLHTSLVSENTGSGCQSTHLFIYYFYPFEERLLHSKALNRLKKL